MERGSQLHHPGPQEKRKLEFTDQELGIIVKAMFELPYRVAAPIIETINRQLQPPNERANGVGAAASDEDGGDARPVAE